LKLIIFDIDGTLCNSNFVDDKCYIKAFKDITSIEIENSDWDSYKNATELGIIEQLFLEYFQRNPREYDYRTAGELGI
jgi:beta-phosphoglucomutase-like phosphatase (HAD superfamily)